MMNNYYLAFSELTKRVYITNGKKKIDVTDQLNEILKLINKATK